MTHQPPTTNHQFPIIAIDGPAASGKGTLSRRIAEALGFAHLDTGALYRAVGFEVLENAEDPINAAQNIDASTLSNPRLKDDDVGQAASKIAAIPEVRQALLDLQHNFAKNPPAPAKGSVLDGRDIGTIICPNANVKLFIIAEVEIRSKRRFKELSAKPLQSGQNPVTYEAVLKDMRERDARDQGRKTAPMVPADDAVIVDTSHLSADQAFEKAMSAIRDRIKLS